MSIFRNTFTKEVREQLKVRQNALNSRSPQAIQQINARNAWVRMTSGVNVEGKSTLAEQYILQGGILLDKKLRSGIGINSGAYNTQTPGGKANIRGIRPMPGITSVDIQSKSAYGSLREVTVNFICHDISQLEDLELLYMRPGYTVLVEWGWTPYIDNNNKIVNTIKFYDDVLKGGKDFPTILSELFQRSKDHHGNYDALYGYVKNYSWTARMDGGYDCQTTIISIGEILESLKVNVTSFDANQIAENGGLIFGKGPNTQIPGFSVSPGNLDFASTQPAVVSTPLLSPQDLPNLPQNYAENNLVGLLYELTTYVKIRKNKFPDNNLIAVILKDKKGIYYDMLGLKYNSVNTSTQKIEDSVKSYITLDSFIKLLNNYIVLGVKKSNEDKTSIPIAELSSKPNQYDSNDIPEEEKESLLCLAHPLQVSADLDVCLITNPIYAKGIKITIPEITAGQENGASSRFDPSAKELYDKIKEINSGISGFVASEEPAAKLLLEKLGFNETGYTDANATEFARAFYNAAKSNPNDAFKQIEKLKDNVEKILSSEEEELKRFKSSSDILFQPITYNNFATAQAAVNKAAEAIGAVPSTTLTLGPVDYLATMQVTPEIKKFQYGNKDDELGKIGNIYLNMDNLLQIAKDVTSTTSEKKEIKLYDYLKKVLSQVQESIGNVNNFEIHTDPIDSKPRIIDVNYTETDSAKQKIFNNAFKIEIANTSGSVRSYNLQSQIFPEQSAMISISAQVGNGGEQGYQNNTLLDFNRGITDRIITKKIDQASSINSVSDDTKLRNLAGSIKILQERILPKTSTQSDKTPNIDTSNSNNYKAALRDIIAYVQGITNSSSKNRSIIPVKISLTMDGIGGLVIGHLFKFPSELLPDGYKFDKDTEGIGAKLLQTVMRLGHKIENNDWTTTIEAYNIVFNNPAGSLKFSDLYQEGTGTLSIPPAPPGTSGGGTTPNATKLILDLTRNNIASIKGNELNNGGEIESGIATATFNILSSIKKQYPDITLTVTSGNDTYHQNNPGTSNHKVGKAVDFTISPATKENQNKVKAILDNYKKTDPLFRYLDEYSRLSEYASGQHFHMSYNVTTAGA